MGPVGPRIAEAVSYLHDQHILSKRCCILCASTIWQALGCPPKAAEDTFAVASRRLAPPGLLPNCSCVTGSSIEIAWNDSFCDVEHEMPTLKISIHSMY